jgi:hypothetical protein
MPWVVKSIDGQQSFLAPIGKTLYLVAGDAGLSAVHTIPDNPALIKGTLGTYICEQELNPYSHTQLYSRTAQSWKLEMMT